MKTHLADYGLLAVRTSTSDSKYKGITLFMLPLDLEGVIINKIDAISDENFYEVIIEQVELSKEHIIGEIDQGWEIINRALTLERTGLDYYIRSQKWLKIIIDNMNDVQKERYGERLSGLAFENTLVREYVFNILNNFDQGKNPRDSEGAIIKYYSSELANKVVRFGIEVFGTSAFRKGEDGIYSHYDDYLESIIREAPGLLLSAGTTEIMLETIVYNELIK